MDFFPQTPADISPTSNTEENATQAFQLVCGIKTFKAFTRCNNATYV